MQILDSLIAMMLCIGFSAFTAMLNKNHNFSMNLFLATFAICVAILVWIPLLPFWFISVSFGLIILILFSEQLLGRGFSS